MRHFASLVFVALLSCVICGCRFGCVAPGDEQPWQNTAYWQGK